MSDTILAINEKINSNLEGLEVKLDLLYKLLPNTVIE